MTPALTKRILATAVLLVIALFTQWLSEPTSLQQALLGTDTPVPAPDGLTRVVNVVDGDTIEIEGGARVRYIGVDTPETVHPTKGVQCFGREASDYNKKILEGGLVRLERDISDTDKYDRLLRYVYLPDGTFVNLKLVADGYAHVSTYPPDVAHTKEFLAAQSEARSAGRGLWSSCPTK